MRAGIFRMAPVWKLAALLLPAAGLASLVLAMGSPAMPAPAPPARLAPTRAVGMTTDTLLVGGYARGSFNEAMQRLASDLSTEERELVGQHLDRIFAGVVAAGGLGRGGRLRVAYERTVRPDGTTRSIRVLTAEAAVAGEMHTAYYYEHDGKPGYYDDFGRTLEAHAWSSPLAALRVTSAFGSHRMHPILHRYLPHTGVDYGAPLGTPVRATADGVVISSGPNGGYGKMVEIQHPNGYSTRYAHLSRIVAGRALFVHQGDVIGYVGMTGLATGPHLHYEVRRNGRPVNPTLASEAPPLTTELEADPAWPAQRHALSRLLSRTPTILQLGAGSDHRS
jgi:murein DD-endopeptidase MepM/ murein hydrolase activator NlpD